MLPVIGSGCSERGEAAQQTGHSVTGIRVTEWLVYNSRGTAKNVTSTLLSQATSTHSVYQARGITKV